MALDGCATRLLIDELQSEQELAEAVRSARAAYTQFWNARLATTPLDPLDEAEKVIPKEAQPDFMEATVLPLWRKVEMTWPTGPDSLLRFGGPQMPVWFSPFRRAELQRQLEVLCFCTNKLPETPLDFDRSLILSGTGLCALGANP